MIEITKKCECCGCEACKQICPKQCIDMIEDKEGFRYPNVNKERCIDCKLCEKVCPINNEEKRTDRLNKTEFFAAYNKNDEEIKNSSSGGIFYLMAKKIFEKNGIVYGVIQESTYDVKFIRATKNEDCIKMRGSKYLQACVGQSYMQAKKDLEEGNYVLFSGTPCQIAALYKFLGKEYDKLYTIDVVCHGVPSNKVFKKYIKNLEKKKGNRVINIKWRDKIKGWGPNRVTVFFENGSKITTPSSENPFQTGFLNNLYLRNSCYECKYAKLPRIGDISLADFWGYEGELKEENKNKGLSTIIISSKKGKQLFNEIEKEIRYHSVEQEYVKTRSRHVYIHPVENENREKFFIDIDKMSFEKICKKYKMRSSKARKSIATIKNKIVKVICKK